MGPISQVISLQSLHDTFILTALPLIRRVARGDAVNLMLFKLVEYLGHTNALLSGLAYDEVCQSPWV